MINVLTKPMPSSLEVGGIFVPINTDYRTWIDVWTILDNPTADPADKGAGVLLKAFPRTMDGNGSVPYLQAAKHPEEALHRSLLFLECKVKDSAPKPPTAAQRRLSKLRLFDWAYDSKRVVSDFEREYRIDLTDTATQMHWWRFIALFNGLSDSSQTMTAMQIRGIDLDDKRLGKDERKHYQERQQALMLPARTREEASRNSRLRGVDV